MPKEKFNVVHFLPYQDKEGKDQTRMNLAGAAWVGNKENVLCTGVINMPWGDFQFAIMKPKEQPTAPKPANPNEVTEPKKEQEKIPF